jgi:hypothetical protein
MERHCKATLDLEWEMLTGGKQTATPLGSIGAVSVFRHYHEPLQVR